jgi:hypothetical protein
MDYFSKVELIPLETTDDVLIGQMSKLIFFRDRYYTLDKQQMIVHVFDKSGRFLFKIDNRGQGPGQYQLLYDIIINPFTGYLELLSPFGFIYRHDLSGKYIETIRIKSPEILAVHWFIPIDENTYVFYGNSPPFVVIRYDISTQNIIYQAFEEQYRLGSFSNQDFCPFAYYHDDWYVYHYFNAECFKIGENGLLTAYIWDFGKLQYDQMKINFTVSDANNHTGIINEVSEKCKYWILCQGQNWKYIFAQVRIKNLDFKTLIFDKEKQECKYIDAFAESVVLNPLIVTNDYLMHYCNPGELDEYIVESMLDEENKAILKEQKSIIGANPIILKYTFK